MLGKLGRVPDDIGWPTIVFEANWTSLRVSFSLRTGGRRMEIDTGRMYAGERAYLQRLLKYSSGSASYQ